MSMDAVAALAGVGKPAIYRRFANKTELVCEVIRSALPPLDPPPPGEPREQVRHVIDGLPRGEGYAGLIGELMAERERHPELLAAFREHVLAPRRAVVLELLSRLRSEGVVRADVSAEYQLEALGGAYLVRVYAGLDTGEEWRRGLLEDWWAVMAVPFT